MPVKFMPYHPATRDRGRKMVVLVGEWRALATAVRNNHIRRRYTWLAHRLAGSEGAVHAEMLPEVGREMLADFVDVFCDEGFFTPADTARILDAAARWGLKPKVHVDELAATGGLRVAVEHGAISVDHLEHMPASELAILRDSTVVPTVLPGASFFLNMPYAPARSIIDSGLPLALASDYNPGSTPSGDMKFVCSLACIKMRLLPAEAINAATVNAAIAMGLGADYGSIAPGKVANFFITEPVPSVDFIPYAYTTPIIKRVFLRGKEV